MKRQQKRKNIVRREKSVWKKRLYSEQLNKVMNYCTFFYLFFCSAITRYNTHGTRNSECNGSLISIIDQHVVESERKSNGWLFNGIFTVKTLSYSAHTMGNFLLLISSRWLLFFLNNCEHELKSKTYCCEKWTKIVQIHTFKIWETVLCLPVADKLVFLYWCHSLRLFKQLEYYLE